MSEALNESDFYNKNSINRNEDGSSLDKNIKDKHNKNNSKNFNIINNNIDKNKNKNNKKNDRNPQETTPLIPSSSNITTNSGSDSNSNSVSESITNSDRKQKTLSVYLLLIPTIFITTSLSMTVPILINLIINLLCINYYSKNKSDEPINFFSGVIDEKCQIPDIYSKLSNIQLILSVLDGIFSSIIVSWIGQLSDRIGRRKVFLYSTIGGIAPIMLLLFLSISPNFFGIYFIFIIQLLSTFTSTLNVFKLVGNSYVSDCTSTFNRSFLMSLKIGSISIGFTIGPILSGILTVYFDDLQKPFLIIIPLYIIGFLLIYFTIKESISYEQQYNARVNYQIELKERNKLSNLKKVFEFLNVITPIKYLLSISNSPTIKLNLIILIILEVVNQAINTGFISTSFFYGSLIFHWSTFEMGYFLSFDGFSRSLIILLFFPLLIKFIQKRWGSNFSNNKYGISIIDIHLLRFIQFAQILSTFLLPFARTTSQFIGFYSIGILLAPMDPILQTTFTKYSKTDETGKILGALTVLSSLSSIISPIIYQSIYSLSIKSHPTFIFNFTFVLFIITFLSSFLIRRAPDNIQSR